MRFVGCVRENSLLSHLRYDAELDVVINQCDARHVVLVRDPKGCSDFLFPLSETGRVKSLYASIPL